MMAYAILSLHDLFGGSSPAVRLIEDNVDALNELEEMDLVEEIKQGLYTPTIEGYRTLLLPEDSVDGVTPAPPVRGP